VLDAGIVQSICTTPSCRQPSSYPDIGALTSTFITIH